MVLKGTYTKTVPSVPQPPYLKSSVREIRRTNLSLSRQLYYLMECLQVLQTLPHVAPQGPEAKEIRKKCVTGSQASSVLSFPYTVDDKAAWVSYSDHFGVERNPQSHGYIGYRSHHDLWKSRHGLDTFKGNEATQWGNQLESTALLIYELLFDTKCHELGILPDAEHDWLYISPDAITEDGFMVEIKCPLYRQLKDDGWMSREYWAQTQLQLRVCNSWQKTNTFKLRFCQNKFSQYESAKHYLTEPYCNKSLLEGHLRKHRQAIKVNPLKRVWLFAMPLKGAIVKLSSTTSIPPPSELLSTGDEMVVWAMRTSRAARIIANFVSKHCFKKDAVDVSHVMPMFWWHRKMTSTLIVEDKRWFDHVKDEMKMNNLTSQIDDFYAI